MTLDCKFCGSHSVTENGMTGVCRAFRCSTCEHNSFMRKDNGTMVTVHDSNCCPELGRDMSSLNA